MYCPREATSQSDALRIPNDKAIRQRGALNPHSRAEEIAYQAKGLPDRGRCVARDFEMLVITMSENCDLLRRCFDGYEEAIGRRTWKLKYAVVLVRIDGPRMRKRCMHCDGRFCLRNELTANSWIARGHSLPNVRDEPRRELARRVQHHDSLSAVSFRSSFDRTRRDRSRRWLWRLVRRV